MNEIFAIGALDATGATAAPRSLQDIQPLRSIGTDSFGSTAQAAASSFSSLFSDSLARMDAKIAHADEMVTRFAIDDNMPVHQVTIALEQARLSVELAMQVRQRFVEGYRELMNMQL